MSYLIKFKLKEIQFIRIFKIIKNLDKMLKSRHKKNLKKKNNRKQICKIKLIEIMKKQSNMKILNQKWILKKNKNK